MGVAKYCSAPDGVLAETRFPDWNRMPLPFFDLRLLMEVAGLRQIVSDAKRWASVIARCTHKLSLVQEEWDPSNLNG